MSVNEMPKWLKEKRDELYDKWWKSVNTIPVTVYATYKYGFNDCYEIMQKKLDIAESALRQFKGWSAAEDALERNKR